MVSEVRDVTTEFIKIFKQVFRTIDSGTHIMVIKVITKTKLSQVVGKPLRNSCAKFDVDS